MSGQAGPAPSLSLVVVAGLPGAPRAELLASLAERPGAPLERALRLEPASWPAPALDWEPWDGPLDLHADLGAALQRRISSWAREGVGRALLVLGPWAEPLHVALAVARAGAALVGWALVWEADRWREALGSSQEVCAWAGLEAPQGAPELGVAEFVVRQAEFAGELALLGALTPAPVQVSPTQCACGESPQAARRRLGLAQARAELECLAGLLGRSQVRWEARAVSSDGFSWLGATEQAGWARALKTAQAEPEEGWRACERVGRAESRVFSARRPFHPERLAAVMAQGWAGVARARGFVWMATQMKWVGLLERAGGRWSAKVGGIWWADRDEQERPKDARGRARLEAMWREPWGDRRQELAVIGEGVGWEALGEALRAALLTDEEMTWGQLGWRYLRDPWPGLEARGVAGELAQGSAAVDSVRFEG